MARKQCTHIGFGIAEEDINCRCVVLERARWAVEDEESFTKVVDGDIVEFKNAKDYQNYKEKYFNFYKEHDKITKTEKEGKENVKYEDVTESILKIDKKDYKIIKQQYYKDKNGNKYKVDGKKVILNPTEREIQVAKIIGEIYGGKVKIIPRVSYPLGIKTPDYIIGDERFDLKQISGSGKYVIEGNLKKKQEQANNFIIDITQSQIGLEEVEKQINSIYISKRYRWVNKISIIKEDNLIKVYQRK